MFWQSDSPDVQTIYIKEKFELNQSDNQLTLLFGKDMSKPRYKLP